VLEALERPQSQLRSWFGATLLMQGIWHRIGQPQGDIDAWCDTLVAELAASGALCVRDGTVHNS